MLCFLSNIYCDVCSCLHLLKPLFENLPPKGTDSLVLQEVQTKKHQNMRNFDAD